MLETKVSFPFEAEGAYELSIPKCARWDKARQRILILMQTVDGRDLKAKGVLADRNVKQCFVNAVRYAKGVARAYKEDLNEPALMVAPFNQKKHLNLKGQARKSAEAEFAAHAHKLIKKVKPTHVLVSGDEAFHALWPTIEQHQYKRGWVHDLKSGDLKLKVTSTLDFARLLEKQGKFANLLGFWCRHFANLMLGENPHSIAGVKPTPRYIDTIEKFDRLMERLEAEDLFALDTETRDLSVKFNAIYTIQFALGSNPDVGYVLPIDHPLQECWTKEQIKYIKKRLRAFLRGKPNKKKTMVTFNGMYDLRVVRRCLKLAIIWHDVWEITAGEHNLDENIVELSNFGSKPGNLAAVLCSYGNDWYMTAEFSKADRATTGTTKPTDKGFLKYASMDVVSLLYMRIQQIRRAAKQKIDGKNYRPYFERHMIDQMGDTAHVLSHLREDGSLVDAKYLRYLVSPESPLRAEMKILNNAFRGFPEAVEANTRILGNAGFKSKGLFAKSKALNWALSLSKQAHLRTLFFDVMGFEPVNETKGGEQSVDKDFIAANKDRNQVVASYGDYNKLSKLLGTYAKGWLKKLRSNKDSIDDHHLRPDYSFFDVATGRLASKNPSLQTIPNRGKLAKIIKRMFVTRKGFLLVRFDYSAHEVRVWSYAGLDKVLAGIFRVGQKLRQAYIATPGIPYEDRMLKKKLEEWFAYNPETGDFTWKKARSKSTPVGSKAGSKREDSWYLTLDGELFRAHRIAFLMTYGYLPEEVDHKDNNPFNNKIKNLRPATRLENSRNRRMDSTKTSSGYKGVYPGPNKGTWVAQIKPGKDNGTGTRVKHLGVFDSPEDAHKAYVKAAKKYHGDFANSGEGSLSKDDGDYRHPTVKALADIKMRGDIHILNVKRLLGKDVDKEHPLRDAIKAVIFGLLYGKSAETLGEDTKLADKNALLAKIGNTETPKAEAKQAEKDLHALLAEDRTDYAQGLINKIFTEFRGGGQWTNRMKKMVEEQYQVFSPIGRIRHLYAAMTGDRGIVAQQVRRGSNAPIQGFASEIGVKAGRLIMELYYKHLKEICGMLDIEYDEWELRVPYNRMVHDANYFTVPYAMMLPFIHILQYAATYGVTKVYAKEFNIEFPVEPEIEIEVGVRDDMCHKWDWSLPNIVDGVIKSIDEAAELGLLEGERDDVLMEVFKPWRDKEMRKWLQTKFPLLDVTDLDKQIVEAIRPIYLPKKKEAKCTTKTKKEVAATS